MYRNRVLPVSKHICRYTNNGKLPLTMSAIPQPKSLPLIGTKLELIAAGGGSKLHEYIDSRHKKLGPIFCEKLGSDTELIFISDPLMIRDVFLNLEGKYPEHILPEPWVLYEKLYGSQRGLFFMNGEEWLGNRRVMNKYLLKEGTEKWMEAPVKATIGKFIEKWKLKAEKGNFIPNLESEFYRLSIDVIIAIMLGSKSYLTFEKRSEDLLEMFSESVKKIFHTTTKLYGLPVHLCYKFNLSAWKNFKDSVDMSLILAHKLVEEILSKKLDSNGLVKFLSEENLGDKDIKRIIGDFVIAAGDTTSYTSLWSFYLISKNINVKEEFNHKNPTYTNHIIKETMRLFPVAPFLTRILPKESVLGPYELNRGTPIIASIYTSGRDENNFSRANEFLPYRWDRNDSRKKLLESHVPSASQPFALGARSCIGRKLAMLQMSELINQVVQNFEFDCLNEDEVTAKTSQVLVPNQEIKLLFKPRTTDCKMETLYLNRNEQ